MTHQEEDAFYRELLNDFRIEAGEHLETISQGLTALDRTQTREQQLSHVEMVFRATHSLKGASRAVNLMKIEKLSAHFENIFHSIKSGQLGYSSGMSVILFQCLDVLEVMIGELGNPGGSVTDDDINQSCQELEGLMSGTFQEEHATSLVTHSDKPKEEVTDTVVNATSTASFTGDPPDLPPQGVGKVEEGQQVSGHETVRISVPKLHELMLQTEELLHIKGRLFHQGSMAEGALRKLGSVQKHFSKTETPAPLEALNQVMTELRKIQHETEQTSWLLNRQIESLGGGIKEVLLQPIGTLLRIVPRMIKDISQSAGKEVDYMVSGTEIMVDRRILEILKDPLIHLIRNAIDHGIELPEVRKKAGKNLKGHVRISVQEDIDGMIRLVVSDDGAGIDTDQVVRSAVESGYVRSQETASMSDTEKWMLIFSSGVTTARYITDISGRGLGMAIVSTAITEAGGQISLQSSPGEGTHIEMRLPKSIAASKGLLVKVGAQTFLIPVSHVERALSVKTQQIETIEGKRVLRVNQERYGLVDLPEILSARKGREAPKQEVPGILIHHSGIRFVFMVDAIDGEFEGVVKPLGSFLEGIRYVSGVCVLGSGQMVCVLQTADLIDAAMELFRQQTPGYSAAHNESTERKRLLVAEDSITVRNMLKSYLNASGFDVTTAVDGLEAFSKLQKEAFDLVVSDVEMPGMNGFDLTKKIRGDTSLLNLPVILVTALETTEDKRKGMECGANAYIVKSSFEKSNLVEAINRLI